MNNTQSKEKIIMLGPASECMGGISRVVKTWQNEDFFAEYKIKYIPTVSHLSDSKLLFLIKSFIDFILSCGVGCRGVYVHTASKNSFFRKCIFLATAFLFGNKVILHIHPSFFYVFLSELSGVKKKIAFLLLSRVYSFVVLTREMRNNMQQLFPDKNVYILRTCVSVEEMANKNGLVRHENRLLYLGWYNERKGIYDLVDAIQRLFKQGKEIQADFYGTKEIDKLTRYVENKRLANVIKVNGWINDDKKIEALYKSTMLILPSHSEGIPNVILEAMATKTPIVSTLAGGLSEVLEDCENAIIAESRNPLDLSEKILRCLDDPVLRKKIAVNAYNEAQIKYNLPIITKELAKILETF